MAVSGAALDRLFEQAQEAAKTTTVSMSNDDKLQIYAHYKQATVGVCEGSRPSSFSVALCYKYDAWKALGSMDKEAAKSAYIAIMDRLDPSWRPSPAPPAVAEAAAEDEDLDEDLFHSIISDTPETPMQKLFAHAMQSIKIIPMVQVRDEVKLQLYALYKQATKGQAPEHRPPASQVQACVKHGAWVALGTLTKEDAMAGYCKVVESILPGWRKNRPACLQDEQALLEVDLATSEGLGMQISRDARGLLVESVDEGGAVGRWNKANPESQVGPGDLILTVNGQRVEPNEKPMSYAVGGKLMLHIRKAAAVESKVAKPANNREAPASNEAPVRRQGSWKGCFTSAQMEQPVGAARE